MPLDPNANEPLPDEPTARIELLRSNESTTDSAAADEKATKGTSGESVTGNPSLAPPAQVMRLAAADPFHATADVSDFLKAISTTNTAGDGTIDVTARTEEASSSIGPPTMEGALLNAATPSSTESPGIAMASESSLASTPLLDEAGKGVISRFHTMSMLGMPSQEPANVSAFMPAEKKVLGELTQPEEGSKGVKSAETGPDDDRILSSAADEKKASEPGVKSGASGLLPTHSQVRPGGNSIGSMPFGTVLRHSATTVARVDVRASLSDLEHRMAVAIRSAMAEMTAVIQQEVQAQVQYKWTKYRMQMRAIK